MEENNNEKIYYINVEDILPNRFQPRLAFDEQELNNLSESIIKYGVIQPIVVRKIGEKYEIIAGERRYKAACLAGLKSIPAVLNNTDDNTSAEIALLENLQRKDLSVIEEAQSYKKLIDRGFTQEEIASKLGISQSAIANKMRLLSLPKEIKDALLYNQISERHARSLLTLNNEDLQKSLLKKIISDKLTVKQTEEEINLLLMRDNIKQENYVPEEIQRFLRPENKNDQKPEAKEETIEFLDIGIPDIQPIEDEDEQNNIKEDTKIEEEHTEALTETTSTEEAINPFQLSTNSDEQYIESRPTPIEIEKKDNSEEIYNYLSNIIDNYSIGKNNIKTEKIELADKYQITIEIEKY